jgi:hypothetical protein
VSDDVEMDSDAREDSKQEALLDRSFNDWVTHNIENQTKQQQEITDVPNGNVWEAASPGDKEG